MAMTVFNQRMRAYRDYMGMRNVDLENILCEKRSNISAWLTDNEDHARAPKEFGVLVSVSDTLWSSLDFLAGRPDALMWNPAITPLRIHWQSQAAAMKASNVYQRLLMTIDMIKATLPKAQDEWFLAGVLNLGRKGTEFNVDAVQRFLAGTNCSDAVLARATERLAGFTGLSFMWIQLGDPKYLTDLSGSDLGDWHGFWERAKRRKHTPEQYLRHFERIDQMFREHESLM